MKKILLITMILIANTASSQIYSLEVKNRMSFYEKLITELEKKDNASDEFKNLNGRFLAELKLSEDVKKEVRNILINSYSKIKSAIDGNIESKYETKYYIAFLEAILFKDLEIKKLLTLEQINTFNLKFEFEPKTKEEKALQSLFKFLFIERNKIDDYNEKIIENK